MKVRRVIKWTVLGGLLTLGATAGVLYLLADWTPSDYKPQVLTDQEKAEVREAMERKFAAVFDPENLTAEGLMAMDGVENVHSEQEVVVDAETGERKLVTRTTFGMPMTSDELNKYISSMPEATLGRLQSSGLTQPAIAIGADRMTFYAHVTKYDKVVGLDLGFEFDEEGAVTIDMRFSWVGRLPIPDVAMARYKAKMTQRAKADIEGVSRSAGKLAGGEMGKTAAMVVRSLGPKIGSVLAGKPVTLDIRQGSSDVRIRGITTVKGKMTLDMVAVREESLDAAGAEGKAAQAAAGASEQPGFEPAPFTPVADQVTPAQATQLAELGR
jgi:hypothetical protein